MIVSIHTHAESTLTGSTLSSLIAKAKSLGREYFAYTDNGHLSSALKAYNNAKESGLKPILGIEFYFKDPIEASVADRAKYFTGTIYATDQESYQALCEVASKTVFSKVDVYGESHNLWTWKELEYLSKFNTRLVIGGSVHCMVGKTYLSGAPKVAEAILLKAKDLFGERLSLAIVSQNWSKRWASVVQIEFDDNTKVSALASSRVTTNRAKNIKIEDLVGNSRHSKIYSIRSGNSFSKIGKDIKSATLHNGYIPFPGGDVSFRINKFLLALSNKHKVNTIVTDYVYYANKDDKVVQSMVLGGNIRYYANMHMQSKDEILDYLKNSMKMSDSDAEDIINRTDAWAHGFDNFKLEYEYRFVDAGENPIKQVMDLIKQRGRMKWDDPIYVSRLKEEIEVIAKNPKHDLTPYFLPIVGVLDNERKNGRITGPARGSAAGSLMLYLMGVTQVNPLKHELSFNRFYSLDRIMADKPADVDVDLMDRDLLVGEDKCSGYLYGTYGKKAAQVSTRTTVRLKSAILDVNRYFNGKVEKEIEILTQGLPQPPQGISDLDFVFGYEDDGNHIPGLMETSDSLKQYIESRPKEWAIVEKAMGITRSFSTHASAFVITNKNIDEIVPTKEGHIIQYEAKETEIAGLIKYDFLVVKQLADINNCLNFINKKNNEVNEAGYFTHNGQKLFIWDLPELPEAFKSVWSGYTETCFQINTRSMIPFVQQILPESIEDLAIILALVRPGPLDYVDPNTGRSMAQEYVYRRQGNSYEDIAILNELIPETKSILIYQEQITKIAKEVAGFSGSESENLREAVGKKQMAKLLAMRPKFIEGVVKSGKATEDEARELFARIETAGRYSFNKSHAVAYAYITYACIFLRHFYTLEWWASVLTNAKEKEITGKFWPYIKDMVYPPDINISTDVMEVDYKNKKLRSKLGIIRGMSDASIDPILEGRPYKDISDFVKKGVAKPAITRKLIHVGVLDSLFPESASLIEKLKMYEDELERKKFSEKIKSGKKTRALGPKEGVVPEEYLNLTPMQDVVMKKQTLPSMPIDTYNLGKKYSKVLKDSSTVVPILTNERGYDTVLIPGRILEHLDQLEPEMVHEDKYFACTGYVIESKEFSFANGSKRALKITLDVDGYISEKVLWPDYNTSELKYPKELKKGVIATVFMCKRAGKKDVKINSVVVES